MLPPGKLVLPQGAHSPPLPAVPVFHSPGFLPIRGTKNPRADLISLTRPLRPLLIRSHFIWAAPAVKTFFSVFLPELRTRNCYHFTSIRFAVKNFLRFFSAPETIPFTKNGGRDYRNPEPAQYFFETFFLVLSTLPAESHFCPGSPG